MSDIAEKTNENTENESIKAGRKWGLRVKVVLICVLFGSISNYVYNWRVYGKIVYPWELWPGLLLIGASILIACVLSDITAKFMKNPLPLLFFVAVMLALASFPFTGSLSQFVATYVGKITMMPVFAAPYIYTGLSLGSGLKQLKSSAVGIVLVHIVTLLGTVFGSLIIAQLILSGTHII